MFIFMKREALLHAINFPPKLDRVLFGKRNFIGNFAFIAARDGFDSDNFHHGRRMCNFHKLLPFHVFSILFSSHCYFLLWDG